MHDRELRGIAVGRRVRLQPVQLHLLAQNDDPVNSHWSVMSHEAITRRVLNALKQGVSDFQEDGDGNRVEYQNIGLQHTSRLDEDGDLDIQCWPRVKSREGLGPMANTLSLNSDFWEIWDAPPTLNWITEAPTSLHILGTIDAVDVAVNLWSERKP